MAAVMYRLERNTAALLAQAARHGNLANSRATSLASQKAIVRLLELARLSELFLRSSFD